MKKKVKTVKILSLENSKKRGLNCDGLNVGQKYTVIRAFDTYYQVVRDFTTFFPAAGWVSKEDVEVID